MNPAAGIGSRPDPGHVPRRRHVDKRVGDRIHHGDPGEVEGPEAPIGLPRPKAASGRGFAVAFAAFRARFARRGSDRLSLRQELDVVHLLGTVEDGDAVFEFLAVCQQRVMGGWVGLSRRRHDRHLVEALQRRQRIGDGFVVAGVDDKAAGPTVPEEPVKRIREFRAGAIVLGHELADELRPVVDGLGGVVESVTFGGGPDEGGGARSNRLDRPVERGNLLHIDARGVIRAHWHKFIPSLDRVEARPARRGLCYRRRTGTRRPLLARAADTDLARRAPRRTGIGHGCRCEPRDPMRGSR